MNLLRRSAGLDQRLISGVIRGTIAAMAMTGMRQVTGGLGLVKQTPPDAILKQRAFGMLVRSPRLAYFMARRQVAVVEIAHWFYGAAGGVGYALLPREMHERRWTGVAYGAASWAAFELSIAPLLGLEHSKAIRPVERLMFLADHLLFGTVLAGGRRWALPPRVLSRNGG